MFFINKLNNTLIVFKINKLLLYTEVFVDISFFLRNSTNKLMAKFPQKELSLFSCFKKFDILYLEKNKS